MNWTVVVALASAGWAAGCAGTAASPEKEDTPAALVNGKPLAWSRLQPGLAELAGGQVLEEVVLDMLLAQRCAERGIAVGANEVGAERALLVESMDPSPDRAEELLRAVRASRRMGEVRFEGALRRSAMLRALVSVDGSEEAAEFAIALRVRQSERSLVRVLVTANEADAAAARARIVGEGNGPVEAMRFAAVAAELSLDESGARGGLYGEISPIDSGQPAGLRRAVERTEVGHVTPVVGTGSAFVVAYVEKRLPARDALTADEKLRLARDVHARAQRRAMELLARQVLAEAKIAPMDRSLGWSWDQRAR